MYPRTEIRVTLINVESERGIFKNRTWRLHIRHNERVVVNGCC